MMVRVVRIGWVVFGLVMVVDGREWRVGEVKVMKLDGDNMVGLHSWAS